MAPAIRWDSISPDAQRRALERMTPEERAKFDAAGPIPKDQPPPPATAVPKASPGPGVPKPAPQPAPVLDRTSISRRGDGFGLLIGLAIAFAIFAWLDGIISPRIILALVVVVGIGALWPPLAIGVLAVAFLAVALTHAVPAFQAFQGLFSTQQANPRTPTPRAAGSSGTQTV